MRGYFGIGVYQPKKDTNLGTLWRSAQSLGAAYMFTIGRKYKHQSSDTTQAWRHIPLLFFESVDDWLRATPRCCRRIGIEITDSSHPIAMFQHPPQAVYLLGREDSGIPPSVLNRMEEVIQLPGTFCLNVAVAGSILMFDRFTKANNNG